MYSCLYEGTVSHRRRSPVEHQFRYRIYMVLLDLNEIPALVGRRSLIGDSKTSVRSFLRSDHLFDPAIPLTQELRQTVFLATERESNGPIRLLTQLRSFGYYMSPLNLFYCFDASDQRIETVVAEVNNTPWNERHCYVLWDGNRQESDASLTFSHPKHFHVSPFMPMNMTYQWQLSPPEQSLQVHLANVDDDGVQFEAGMSLKRQQLNRMNLTRMSIRYPLMTARIVSAIYFQALKLWWKKCPSYTHPKNNLN
ncbi:MAG: DUF1365 domain-containing protein [Pirellulaceae bacterium]